MYWTMNAASYRSVHLGTWYLPNEDVRAAPEGLRNGLVACLTEQHCARFCRGEDVFEHHTYLHCVIGTPSLPL